MKKKQFVDAVNGIQMKDEMKKRMVQRCKTADLSGASVRRPTKKLIAVACAAALVLVFSVTAFASNLFGLKDMLFVHYTESDGDGGSWRNDGISLAGYMDSSEAKACAEWNAFLDSYDQDETILNQIGNEPTAVGEKYGEYMVYTQEMADKLEEIAAKYHLRLLKHMEIAETGEAFKQLLGGKSIVREPNGGVDGLINEAAWGYVYDDGSFMTEGDVYYDDVVQVGYQFCCQKRGVLHESFLTIGDASQYEEFAYTTADGTEVTLAIGPEKCLIIADMNTQFIVVNVLEGSHVVAKADLQRMADTFAFASLAG